MSQSTPDVYVVESAARAVRDRGTDCQTHCIAGLPHKQGTALIANEPLWQRISYIGRVKDTVTPLEACRKVDNVAQWAFEHILEMPGTTEALSFFEEVCPGVRLTARSHKQAGASFDRGRRAGVAGGICEEDVSASIGNRVGIFSEVLVDLAGLLGDGVNPYFLVKLNHRIPRCKYIPVVHGSSTTFAFRQSSLVRHIWRCLT